MSKYVLCSPMSATIFMNGTPVPNARVERRYKWHWGDKSGVDKTVTDAQGRFSLPQVDGTSMTGWLPHEPNIEQDIDVYVGDQKYEIWAGSKRDYKLNYEFEGMPSPLRFDLKGEPVTPKYSITARLVKTPKD